MCFCYLQVSNAFSGEGEPLEETRKSDIRLRHAQVFLSKPVLDFQKDPGRATMGIPLDRTL